MSKKANPTLVGVFIATALLLAIAGILFFSSSSLFSRNREYILYFDASLTGLDAGAQVKFRGVNIGSVKEVLIHYNQEDDDSALPVVIEIDEQMLQEKTDLSPDVDRQARMKVQIERGLRARLESQSLLTGLLFVNLEYLPEVPAVYHQVNPTREEIPTAPNQIQVFMQDFAQIAQKLNLVLGKLDTSLADLQVKDLNNGLTNLLASLNRLSSSPDITNTLASANEALTEFRAILKDLRPEIDKLVTSADRALASSGETMTEVRNSVQEIRDVLAPRGPLRRDVTTALEEVANAARSISSLAEFLNQHPNALLSGRSVPATQP